MPKVIFHDSEGVDKTVTLAADPVLIGRASECQIQTQDAMVSRRHARIIWDGNYWIEDLGSSNGVYVGHERVQRAPFRIGDTVTCGSLVLKMQPDTAPRTASMPGTGTPPMGATTLPPPMAVTAPPAYGGGAPLGPPPGNFGAPPPMAPPGGGNFGPPPPGFSYGPPPGAQLGPPPGLGPSGGLNAPPMSPPPPMSAPPAAPAPTMARPVARAEPDVPPGPSAAELEQEKRRRADAEKALLDAEERVKAAEARATEAETAAKEALLLRRKVDQLGADLRRLRGGAAPDPGDNDRDARLQAEVERDQLKLTVAELERKVGGGGGNAEEADKLRRQVDQLNAEVRRLRGGQSNSGDAQRIAELTAELSKVQAAASSGGGKLSAQAADTVVLLGDSLAELRGSLRAANDEATLLTAPKESVEVISDALRSAAEQLEAAREKLRSLAKMVGVG